MNLLASIPSPGSAALHIGPLQLRAYGLMIAIGVIVAVRLWGKRLALIGVGGPDDASGIAVWAVMMFVFSAGLELDLGDAWANRRETAVTAGAAASACTAW